MLVAGNPSELESIMRGLIRRKQPRPEEQIHKAVIQHLQQRGVQGLVYWHTPNGGKRNKREAGKFKAMGVRAGVSDLILLHNSRMYALELKAPGRPSTEAQMQFISDFEDAGGYGRVAAGLSEAIKVLEMWGLLRGVAA